MILPSFLEYTLEACDKRLALLTQSLEVSKSIALQSCNEVFTIHIDYIGEVFAQNRGVLCSIPMKSTFDICISQHVSNIHFTVHCMCEDEDETEIWSFIQYIQQKSETILNYSYTFTLYVASSITEVIKKYVTQHNLRKYVSVGVWYDVDQWDNTPKFIQSITVNHVLLMTVFAGKSGQVLIPESIQKAKEFIKKSAMETIIIDGGITYDNYQLFLPDLMTQHKTSIQFVSYSSFWNKLESKSL